jgi:Fic family protein
MKSKESMKTLELINKYMALELDKAIDYEKFNLYLITNHSTWIEGSRLTLIETQLLLDENITPKGKDLNDSLMTIDHHKALLFTLSLAKNKTALNSDLIKQINSLVMKNTGKIMNTALGTVDSTKGDFRKMEVFIRDKSFPNFEKIPGLVDEFCNKLNKMIKESGTDKIKQLEISFWAHYNLVSIHPFVDGNGRTSRLVMNYVQEYFNLPLAIVFKEDKQEYFTALSLADEKKDITPFYEFMFKQYNKHLSKEINKNKSKGRGFSFIF